MTYKTRKGDSVRGTFIKTKRYYYPIFVEDENRLCLDGVEIEKEEELDFL